MGPADSYNPVRLFWGVLDFILAVGGEGGEGREARITGGCEWLTWLVRNQLCVLCERSSINLWDFAHKLSSEFVSSTN